MEMPKRKATEPLQNVVIPKKSVGEIMLNKINRTFVYRGYEKKVMGFTEFLYIKPVITGEKLQTFVGFTCTCNTASVNVVMRDYEVYDSHATSRIISSRIFGSYIQFDAWYNEPCKMIY